MFNKTTCKVRFYTAVLRQLHWKLFSNQRKPIAFQRNLLGKLPRNRPFFTNRFSAKLASKIPAKSAVFSANLSLKIPRNLTFFRDLPEALTCLTVIFSYTAKESRNTGIILTIELKVIGNDELLNRAKTCYSTLLQSQDTQRGGWLTVG